MLDIICSWLKKRKIGSFEYSSNISYVFIYGGQSELISWQIINTRKKFYSVNPMDCNILFDFSYWDRCATVCQTFCNKHLFCNIQSFQNLMPLKLEKRSIQFTQSFIHILSICTFLSNSQRNIKWFPIANSASFLLLNNTYIERICFNQWSWTISV